MSAMPHQPLGPAAEGADRHRGRLGAAGLVRAGAPVDLFPATCLRRAALPLANASWSPSRSTIKRSTTRRRASIFHCPASRPCTCRADRRSILKSRSRARSRLRGRVEVSTRARGPAAIVPLQALPSDGDQPQAQYRGEYAALSQSARYQVYLGDAWTDPAGAQCNAAAGRRDRSGSRAAGLCAAVGPARCRSCRAACGSFPCWRARRSA